MTTIVLLASVTAVLPVPAAVADLPAGGVATRVSNEDSINWAGYVVRRSDLTSVSAKWTVPRITCNDNQLLTDVAIWIGLDGGRPGEAGTVEQAGIDGSCNGADAEYRAWWELEDGGTGGVPLSETGFPVRAGDRMTCTIRWLDGKRFRITMDNSGGGGPKWDRPFDQVVAYPAGGPTPALNSAEAIVETPVFRNQLDSGEVLTGMLPLTRFGDMTFDEVRVNGRDLGRYDDPDSAGNPRLVRIDLRESRSSGATTLAKTGELEGADKNAFTVKWQHHGKTRKPPA